MADFLRDDVTEGLEFGVARSTDLVRRRVERGETVAVFDQVLLPAHEIHILHQHLHLATYEQTLEGRDVNLDVFDVDFFH